jgi:hypothetical protein
MELIVTVLKILEFLLEELHFCEHAMFSVAVYRNQFDEAEGHCQRCLTYSKRLGASGETKTTCMFKAICSFSWLRRRQGDYSAAVIFAEEAYNLVVDAYDPAHPQVQEAANLLIGCLIDKGDFLNAERFAEQTYQNLRDPKNGMNQEGEEVAKGAYDLADVICRQNGDLEGLIKAEELIREVLRIRTPIFGFNHHCVGVSCDLLARILMTQLLKKNNKSFDRLRDESKELFERSIAIFMRNEGPDGVNTAIGNLNIGGYHEVLATLQPTRDTKRPMLLQAKSHCMEVRFKYLRYVIYLGTIFICCYFS